MYISIECHLLIYSAEKIWGNKNSTNFSHHCRYKLELIANFKYIIILTTPKLLVERIHNI